MEVVIPASGGFQLVSILCYYVQKKERLRVGRKPVDDVSWTKGGDTIVGEKGVVSKLLELVPAEVYPPERKAAIDEWLGLYPSYVLNQLEEHLKFRTYLEGHSLTVADLVVYSSLQGPVPGRVERWRALISIDPIVRRVAADLPKGEAAKGGSRREGVVTRFAPEPSGYLHIGHARAALATEAMARDHKGKFLLRFDDTNPVNESADFEEKILEDTKLLDLTFDAVTHTSDYFKELLGVVEKMIVGGLAFVDDTPNAEIKKQRSLRQPSARRERLPDESLGLWKQMLEGTPEGRACVVRAKIDFASENGCLRDPVIARCIEKKHTRFPDGPPVFPTYDLACPVVDSMSGVTVAMRSWEYTDRDHQYAWFIEKLGLRKVEIVSFSRMSFAYTVLGKRYLRAIVAAGKAAGWDDPRFPTVRGLRRRGIDPATLKRFCAEQGQSRNQNLHAWDKLWSLNRDIIAKTCPRVMSIAVADAVPARVLGAAEGAVDAPVVPGQPAHGTRPLHIGPDIVLEKADVPLFQVGDKVTLMHWGNVIVKAIDPVIELEWADDSNFRGTAKLNWLVPSMAVRLVMREWSQLLSVKQLSEEDKDKENVLDFVSDVAFVDTELLCDASIGAAEKGSIWQLERRAEVIIDEAAVDGRPAIGFLIPSGKQGLTPLALPIKIPLVVE